jgi:hypothetical protein
VPRPPTWLLTLGWALAGLSWLADAKAFTFLAVGVFSALTLWWGLWLATAGPAVSRLAGLLAVAVAAALVAGFAAVFWSFFQAQQP